MKITLVYVVAAGLMLTLIVFGIGAAPQDVAVEGSPDSPIYTIWCDYDGPDAVITPWGSVPASHVHFVGDGSVIKLAPEGDYVYSPDGKLTEFVPKEEETPSWLHRVDITKPWPVDLSTSTPG